MRRLSVVLVVAAVAVAGCRQPAAERSEPDIVATVYPLAYFAQRIAGDAARVRNLSPVGAEPHDLELTSGQLVDLARSDLVVHIGGGFQPAVEDALGDLSVAALDVLAAGEHDPHVWLDPVTAISLSRRITDRIVDLDPDGRAVYERNDDDMVADLRALHRAYRRGLTNCRTRSFITSHDAFGHLARRYELTQIPIAGLEPGDEPSPRRLRDIAAAAQREGVKTVFFEKLVPVDLGEAVAEAADLETAVLDTIETAPARGDYLSSMRANLIALREGLGCG